MREACLLQFQAKKKMVNMREPFLREDLEAGEDLAASIGFAAPPFFFYVSFFFFSNMLFFFLVMSFFLFFCNVGLLGFLIIGPLGFRVAAS